MKRFDPQRHHRRSIRLPGYDYTQAGAYFVTVCIWDRLCLLGEVVDESMRLNDAGRLVQQEWFRAAAVRESLELEPNDFVVMPNHIHGIIHITDRRGEAVPRPESPGREGEAPPRPYPRGAAAGSVGAIIGQFKSVTTKAINAARNSPGAPLWQRGYFEHVVRDEADLDRIRRYIAENPARWAEDPERPESPTHENLVPTRRGEAVPRPDGTADTTNRRGEAVPRPAGREGEAPPRPYGDHRDHGGHGERGGPRR